MTEQIYLDHAATTDVRDDVIELMTRVLRETGNSASLHEPGRRARRHVEEAREQVAAAVGAEPIEVVFTGGATEADNLAVKGGYWTRRRTEPRHRVILTSPAEHHAVLDPVRWLAERQDAQIRWAEVDQSGALPPEHVRAALDDSVAVATAMWVNNETGSVSDIPAIAEICRAAGVPLHCDAVQAIGRLPVGFRAAALDSMAVSAHKIGGPQGVGALVIRRQFTPTVLLHGGGQERRLRSGTLDVAGIAGFGLAITAAEDERASEAERLGLLRDRLAAAVLDQVPAAAINGPQRYQCNAAHPGILSIHAPGASGEVLLMVLDGMGIAVATGSACTSGVAEPSHVIVAMGGDDARSAQTIRVSLGRTTTDAHVSAFIEALPDAVRRAREATGTHDADGRIRGSRAC